MDALHCQELAPIIPAKSESVQQLQADLDSLQKNLRMGMDEVGTVGVGVLQPVMGGLQPLPVVACLH